MTRIRTTIAALAAVGAGAALALAHTTADAYESPLDGVYADHVDWGMTTDMSGPASAAQKPWGSRLSVRTSRRQ